MCGRGTKSGLLDSPGGVIRAEGAHRVGCDGGADCVNGTRGARDRGAYRVRSHGAGSCGAGSKFGYSSSFTNSWRGRHDYRVFHVNHRTRYF